MSKLKKILLFVIIVSSSSVFCQTKEDALNDAKAISKATLDMNFETVIKHTLPSVLEMMGGEDAALKVIQSTYANMKAKGIVFEKAEINKVTDFANEHGQYRCVVEGFNQMTASGQRVKSKVYYLGIYNAADKLWWFIEGNQVKNKEFLDKILPNFETKLTIPEDDVKVEAING